MRVIDWGSPDWGKPGTNITIAANGSCWGPGEHAHGEIEP